MERTIDLSHDVVNGGFNEANEGYHRYAQAD